jgi:hypothetical protein
MSLMPSIVTGRETSDKEALHAVLRLDVRDGRLCGASDHRQRIRDRSSKLYPSSSGPSLSRREIVGLVCGVAADKGCEVSRTPRPKEDTLEPRSVS